LAGEAACHVYLRLPRVQVKKQEGRRLSETLGRTPLADPATATAHVRRRKCPRLLRLASGPHGLVECSRLLLHLKGGHRLLSYVE